MGLAGFHLPGGGIVQQLENCHFLMQGFLPFRGGAPVGGGALQENVPCSLRILDTKAIRQATDDQPLD